MHNGCKKKGGLGFEENFWVWLSLDIICDNLCCLLRRVYFRRCPLLSKLDSTQSANQTPADSLFLLLAACLLMVCVHECVSVCVCVKTPAIQYPPHCTKTLCMLLDAGDKGCCMRGRYHKADEPLHSKRGWRTQSSTQTIAGWDEERSGM